MIPFRQLSLFLSLFLLSTTPTWAAIPPGNTNNISTSQAKMLTEKILLWCNQKNYARVLKMMSPIIQKTVTTDQLKEQLNFTFSVIGHYKPNTLLLRSQVTQLGHTRFIWTATFQKEKGTILILFDKNKQISGFIIRSPSLIKQLKKETSASNLTPQLRKKLDKKVDLFLKGYNQGNWKLFCQHCSAVMKIVLKPPKFQTFRKALIHRYGKYVQRRYLKATTLSMGKILRLYYRGVFKKDKATSQLTIKIAFLKHKGTYKIAGWQLTP